MTAAHDLSPSSLETPYAGLTPGLVLDALDSVGLRGDGRLLQLNSYENRVFQVFLEDGRVVVAKFYRPGRWSDLQILEEHRFAAELAAAEIPVVAPWQLSAVPEPLMPLTVEGEQGTLAKIETSHGPFRFAVTERRAGRAPSLENRGDLEWVGRFIGRMHVVGARDSFKHRHTLTVTDFGWGSRDWLISHGSVPEDAAGEWKRTIDEALECVEAAFERIGRLSIIRLHGDCHIGNVLWTDAGPHFVDLDDAMNGPAVQDMWMLLPGEVAASQDALRALLSGYEDFIEFDDRQLRLIEPLRTLRIVHHSAWLARRWNDPAFPAAFPWFARPAYWREQTQLLAEQVAAMKSL